MQPLSCGASAAVPDRGWSPGCPRGERGVLAIGPPGESLCLSAFAQYF